MFDLIVFVGALVVVAYHLGKSLRDAEIEREARSRAAKRKQKTVRS